MNSFLLGQALAFLGDIWNEAPLFSLPDSSSHAPDQHQVRYWRRALAESCPSSLLYTFHGPPEGPNIGLAVHLALLQTCSTGKASTQRVKALFFAFVKQGQPSL